MEFKGIDVSKWQGNINWSEVKKDGTEFVVIREGYGRKSPNQVDKKFKENYEGAKAAGISIGCYHYSYADSADDAKREAEFCLENIQGRRFEYPVCLDIEDRTMLSLNSRQRTDIVKAFCSEIEKAGYYAMFYCNLNWLNNYLIKEELLPKYDLWLAQWNVPSPAVSCGIWQKSDKGKKLIKKCFVSIDKNYVTMQLYKIAKTENYNKTNDSNVVRHGVTFIPEENPTLFKLKRTYDSDDNSNSTRTRWPHYFIKVFSEYKKLIPSTWNSNEYMFDPLKTSKGERFVEGGRSSWVFTAITGRKGRQNSSPSDYAAILKDYEEKGQTLSQRGANFISKPDPVEYLKEKLEKGGNKSRALTCVFIESTYRLSDTHAYTIVGIKDSGVCLLEPHKKRPLPLKFSELNEKGIKLFKDKLDTKDDITAQNWKAKVEEFKNKYKDQKIKQPYFIFNKKHFKDGKDEFIIPFEEFRSNCNAIEKVNLSKKKGAQGKKTTPIPPIPPIPPTTPTTPKPPKPPTTPTTPKPPKPPKPLTTPKPPKPPTTRPPMQ